MTGVRGYIMRLPDGDARGYRPQPRNRYQICVPGGENLFSGGCTCHLVLRSRATGRFQGH